MYIKKQKGEPCPYILQQITPKLGSKYLKALLCSDSSGCEVYTPWAGFLCSLLSGLEVNIIMQVTKSLSS